MHFFALMFSHSVLFFYLCYLLFFFILHINLVSISERYGGSGMHSFFSLVHYSFRDFSVYVLN